LHFAMLAGSGRSDDYTCVFVTARAPGIGREMARAFVAQKATVFDC